MIRLPCIREWHDATIPRTCQVIILLIYGSPVAGNRGGRMRGHEKAGQVPGYRIVITPEDMMPGSARHFSGAHSLQQGSVICRCPCCGNHMFPALNIDYSDPLLAPLSIWPPQYLNMEADYRKGAREPGVYHQIGCEPIRDKDLCLRCPDCSKELLGFSG